jgi:hypothetical protein
MLAQIGDVIELRMTGTLAVSNSAPDYQNVAGFSQTLAVGCGISKTPDLATDPATGLELTPDGQGIQYTYSVVHNPNVGVPIAFRWATGPNQSDAIPGNALMLSLSGADATVGSHTKTLPWTNLGVPPAGATHLLMVLDPNKTILETNETNNFAAVAQQQQQPGVTAVVAKYDANGPDDGFGPYLTGVKLSDSAFFRATTQGASVTSVRLQMTGQPDSTQPVNSSGVATFAFDPGKLPAGSYVLTATALDANGNSVGADYKHTVSATDHLGFTLQTSVPGDGYMDTSKLRLVAGVANAPNLDFRATATGLPSDLFDSAYASRLGVTFVNHATDAKISQAGSFVGGAANLPINVSTFVDTVADPTQFDWDAYLTPTVDASENIANPQRLGADDSAHVRVVVVPDWLKNAAASYSQDALIGTSLGTGTLGYDFRLQAAQVNLALDGPKGIIEDLFGDLTSSVTSGLDVYLFARLTAYRPDDARFGVGDWNVNVKLLGDTVFSKKLTPTQTNVDIEGTLKDPLTLTGLGTVTIKTHQPVNLLQLLKDGNLPTKINWSFGDEKAGKWQITGHYGLASAKIKLSGKLYAELTQLAASGGLTFDLNSGGGFSLDLAKSWVQLDVAASSKLTLTATGTLGVSFIVVSKDIVEADLMGKLDVDFAARVYVTLDHPLDPVKKDSYVGLKLKAQFFYAVGVLPDGKPDYQPFTDPIVFGPVDLFGLKLPPGPDWNKN